MEFNRAELCLKDRRKSLNACVSCISVRSGGTTPCTPTIEVTGTTENVDQAKRMDHRTIY